MTRQETQARGRKYKRRPWLGPGQVALLRDAPAASQSTSFKKASQPSSQGSRSTSQPASSRTGAKPAAVVGNQLKLFAKRIE